MREREKPLKLRLSNGQCGTNLLKILKNKQERETRETSVKGAGKREAIEMKCDTQGNNKKMHYRCVRK